MLFYVTAQLSENIADIVGLSIAEDVLGKILDEMGINEKDKNQYFEKFFIYYTKNWRIINKEDSSVFLSKNDSHSKSKDRVNLSLHYSNNFNTLFHPTKTPENYDVLF